MRPAFRVAWAALVSLHDETLTFVGGNLAWLALNLPLVLAATFAVLPFLAFDPADEGSTALGLPLLIGLALTLLVPTPAGLALGRLAQEASGRDAPRMAQFWETFKRHWRLGLALYAAGCLGLVVLLANVAFYVQVAPGWLKALAVVWLYGLAFWLALQQLLPPLVLHVPQPRLPDLYRRAALLTLGHPLLALGLLLVLLLLLLLSSIAPPLYALAGGAFVALCQAHALREVRRRLGDLRDEDEVGA